MNFLPDVYVPCEECHGKRFEPSTLEIRYRGRNVSEILDLTVDEAIQFFAYCVQFMNTWQLAFIQQRQGIMSLEFLERVSIGYVAFAASQQARAWWSSGGSSMYDPEFVEFVNQRIEP